MPTYEYECTKCGKQSEYFQSIKEAPKTECEHCGGELVKLLSAGSGLIFKGSGFYITDYKNAGASKPSESSASSSTASSDTASSSSASSSTAKKD